MSAFSGIATFVRAHKLALGAGGALLGAAAVASLVRRARAAGTGRRLVELIQTQLGKPYIWGGRGPDGYDCSGIVVWALRQMGLVPKKWSANADSMWKACERVLIPQPGDLMFFGTLLGGAKHVMVYMGDGKMIGASGGGPKTATPADAKERGAAVKVVDVKPRPDFLGYGRLPVQEEKAAAADVAGMIGLDLMGIG